MSVRVENSYDRRVVSELAQELYEERQAQGTQPGAYSSHGYSGYRFKDFSLAYGEKDKMLLTLIGGLAHDRHKELVRLVDEKVTRLDLAVTVLLTVATAVAALGFAKLGAGGSSGQKYRAKTTYITGDDGGSTLYLGRRSGDRMGRVYDKGVQSGKAPPGFCWRYEAQLRRRAAEGVWQVIKRENFEAGRVSTYVWQFFADRGVTPIYEPGSEAIEVERYISVNDHQKRLVWLTRCVKPVVSQLILAGLEKEVYNSIGLDNPVESYKPKEA